MLTDAIHDQDLDGVFPLAGDIIVAGCGEAAERDNDDKFRNLCCRCNEHNIVRNDDKQEIRLREISCHGHIITDSVVLWKMQKFD